MTRSASNSKSKSKSRTPLNARHPAHSLLARAVAGSLAMAIALPALAQSSDTVLTRYQQLRELQQSVVAGSITSAPTVAAESAAPGAVMGAVGDRSSWQTAEYAVDWGLQAINADAAYARGLTGKGIRLGVFDSGSGLAHDEFAGKDHHSIRIADLLPDGTSCTNTQFFIGPDACFASDGDVVGIDAVYYDPELPQWIRDVIEGDPRYTQAGIAYSTHGTHVSGTIAANRDGSGMHGVAFGADLTAAKLFFDSAAAWVPVGTGASVVSLGGIGPDASAFESMYTQMNADGVRAINHSWGLANEPTDIADFDDIYAYPEDRAYLDIFAQGSRDSGLIQVWAAGNSAGNESPETAPIAGLYATLPRGFAEVEKYWLAVVNTTPDNVLSERSHRCGYAAQWCLAAPGTEIWSTSYGSENLMADLVGDAAGNIGLEVTQNDPSFVYENMSGTSMAAPHVTGALGLLFERFPYLDSAQVRDILLTTATDLGAEGVDDVYGWGLMNLERAIEGYGQLRVDTDVLMDRRAGGAKVWAGEAWDDWSNDIGGPGRLTKSGEGWLRLSGDNSFNGAIVREGILELDGANALTSAVNVDGGELRLNGQLVDTDLVVAAGTARVAASGVLQDSDLRVDGGNVAFNGVQRGGSTMVGVDGALTGVGTLGSTTVAGIIAPGNSIGTLKVEGDYVQTATGTYLAELEPGGRSDQLQVSGKASLDGTLVALPEPGTYYLGEQFGFIRAAGGIEGSFATTDFSAFSPFLKFGLSYAADGVNIEVTRGQLLASAAATPNQRAVAGSADTLAVGQGLPRPLTLLFPEQVGAALDGLSGELHAATPMALVESSRYVRDAALSRAVGALSPEDDGTHASGAWVQVLGGNGTLDGGLGTARTESNTSGVLVGVDHRFGGWNVGLLLGNGRTDTHQAQGRSAKARIDNTHVGLYAGHQWGGFGLRGGLGFSRHDIDSSRQVAFAGYSDGLQASHDAKTTQAFLEAGYRFGGDDAGLEPYLQVARVEVDVDDVREQGGAAALSGRVGDTATTLATAGVRFNKGLKASFQDAAWLHVVGGVGYRRASGDRDGLAELAFDGGSAFAVSGAPIADGAVVAELGLSAWLTARQQLELGYTGQFGDESRDRSLNARWSVRF